MQRRRFVTLGVLTALSTSALIPARSYAADSWWRRLLGNKSSAVAEGLSDSDISAGLKEALRVGAGRAVDGLGVEDGFLGNPEVKIPLPESLTKVRGTLERFGFASAFDDLELRLNRAAEAATPQAKALFVGAIEELTLADVQGIYTGGENAATEYLKSKTLEPLTSKMTPIVDASLADVGAVKALDSIMGRYNQLPLVPKVDANLSDYVVERGLEGIFLMLGREEGAIREDPLKRSTELLRKVFSGS